jgi:hypothetical protein
MINTSGKGTGSQYGSEQVEADSLGWTKVITYIGSASPSEAISSFVYTITANSLSGDESNAIVYFTVPEIYATTYFDYQNHSLFPTEIPFTYSRPGESYVQTGDSKYSFPSNYRKIASKLLNSETLSSGFYGNKYMPISPIIQNPQFFLSSSPVPVLKTALPTDISPYKYFVSDKSSRVISAVYEKPITTNKIVIKFNTIMTVPTINIGINGSNISVDGSQSIVLPSNSDGKCTGLLTLYWNGSSWTKTKWSTMPQFNASGSLSLATAISNITVTQISKSNNLEFNSYSATSVTEDLGRMHLVEVSPRLEIDLTDFVQSISIDKSLDGSNTALPISSLNTNDASITLSGIPAMNGSALVPIFSSQSDQSSTVLANMLRKNVKFYINFNLSSYATPGSNTVSNTYIPGGVFYSDSWNENDIQDVTVQCFDYSRYLQSTPAPDYVANLRSVFEIITNILDLAGFTDYDYDSLHSICNNKSTPLDISYYYCNSQDSTILDALNQIFVAYQIGAYIDEYGIMKFLSLQNILSSTTSNISISEANISQGGLSVSTEAKPGKISLRYQTPKIKQSPSLQNVSDVNIKNSPSFIYTTSNDVVWAQETTDSLGFNYINADMSATTNKFNLNNNDLLDIFHTFSMNGEGFVFIENEVVSFVYKEYKISSVDDSNAIFVSVKNNIELSAEIDRFIKQYSIGLKTSDGSTKADYDVKITPTGNITNVERGLFGTSPSAHTVISSLSSKGLEAYYVDNSIHPQPTTINLDIINNNAFDEKLPDLKKIKASCTDTNSYGVMIVPSNHTDIGYQTYSAKFDIPDNTSAHISLFFNAASKSNLDGAHYVDFYKVETLNPKTQASFSPKRYRYYIGLTDTYGNYFATANVTSEVNNIMNNFSKITKKTIVNNKAQYSYVTDECFNLKVVHWLSDGSDGENATILENKRVVAVFLNNVEISGWVVNGTYDENTNPDGSYSKSADINLKTGMRQKPTIPNDLQTGTVFGVLGRTYLPYINGYEYDITANTPDPNRNNLFNLRELHATKKPLKERSVNYFYQDREFLNGLVQNQPLYTLSPTYIMQTTPEVSGINYYDVQYQTPAAVSVDVLPVEYMMRYFPGNSPEDQTKYQKKLVNEYSLSYSTPINTGFRARMAIANVAPHMVFLKKDADEINDLTINLNLWTHEIVAPSDPEIIEKVIDYSNLSEVVQIDSEWIQSKQAAHRMLKVVQQGIEGFSKTVSVEIFGNPLIQVGDVVTLSYSLNGINQQKYMVQSVSQSFTQGLSTSLILKRIQE